jgi:hypothetical protein
MNFGMEPALEEFTGNWDADKRKRIARVYARWARQLFASASIMEALPQPVARIPLKMPRRRGKCWN